MSHIAPEIAHFPAPMRLLVFLLALLVLWLPLAIPIALLVPNANTVTIATMLVLFIAFLVWVQFWGRMIHRDSQILQTYGLVRSQKNGLELLLGLMMGLIGLFLLFAVQGWLGWIEWRSAAFLPLLGITLAGALTGLGTGLAEELVFRGWLLDELQRDYSAQTALWGSSLTFACLHFIKPLPDIIRTFPQFPGLVLLGLALVWAKRSTRQRTCPSGRLGLSIGLHGGLVWGYYIVHVGELITYPDRALSWLTGIDQNPLAGGVGLVFLASMAGLMRWQSTRTTRGIDR